MIEDQTILDIKQTIETLVNQQKEKLVEETKSHDVTKQNLHEAREIIKNEKVKNEQMQQKINAQGDEIKKQQQRIDSQDLKILIQEHQLMEQSIKIEKILRLEKLFCGVSFKKLFIVGAIASSIVVFLKK